MNMVLGYIGEKSGGAFYDLYDCYREGAKPNISGLFFLSKNIVLRDETRVTVG